MLSFWLSSEWQRSTRPCVRSSPLPLVTITKFTLILKEKSIKSRMPRLERCQIFKIGLSQKCTCVFWRLNVLSNLFLVKSMEFLLSLLFTFNYTSTMIFFFMSVDLESQHFSITSSHLGWLSLLFVLDPFPNLRCFSFWKKCGKRKATKPATRLYIF